MTTRIVFHGDRFVFVIVIFVVGGMPLVPPIHTSSNHVEVECEDPSAAAY
jgi:hypothetical protein